MEKTLVLRIPPQSVASEIVIQKGLMQEGDWLNRLKNLSKRFAIITDHHVEDLFGHAIKNQLEQAGCEVHLFSVPPGEKSKSREWKEFLEDQMLQAKLGRDTALIALGGGVITDLAGFVAATYCRGIPLISIPTTLLAQVDASIGGKVGVNTPQGKNLIGAFYHPRLILIDTEMLKTLNPDEMMNGMAEVIKYALIASKPLFQKLQQEIQWEDAVLESCTIKKDVVEKDPQEKGLRAILNFGHTVGHAIEALMDYQISHGKAVAIGMAAEAHLSCLLGYLQESELVNITSLLEKYGFSLKLPSSLIPSALMQAMQLDKKALSRQPRFVLLKNIGETHPFDGAYCSPVDSRLIQETFQWLHSK